MAKCKVHKYFFSPSFLGGTWMCGNSNCTHFLHKHLAELVLDKDAICNKCGEVYTLTKQIIDRTEPDGNGFLRPICMGCKIGVGNEVMKILLGEAK